MGKEWLFEKYKKAFEDINEFIQPPASDTTKYSYLTTFGQYYIKNDMDYSGRALYAIFWRALDDAKKSEKYHKDKIRTELVSDKRSTFREISNNIIINSNNKTQIEQLKLF